MVLCGVCHRRQGDPCPGCRTLDRIRWLWGAKLRPGEEVEGLAVLRNCAGALSDLVEEGFSNEPPPPFGLPPLPAVPVGGDTGVPVAPARGSGPAQHPTPGVQIRERGTGRLLRQSRELVGSKRRRKVRTVSK